MNTGQAGGYEQELKRSLGSFQVFAISFAFISVAVGIFATYDIVLKSAGPAGIWLWLVVAIGQILESRAPPATDRARRTGIRRCSSRKVIGSAPWIPACVRRIGRSPF